MAMNDELDQLLTCEKMSDEDWAALYEVCGVTSLPAPLARRKTVNETIRRAYGHVLVNTVFRNEFEPGYIEILKATAEMMSVAVKDHHTIAEVEDKLIVEAIDSMKGQIIKKKGVDEWQKIENEIDAQAQMLGAEGDMADLLRGQLVGVNLYPIAELAFLAINGTLGLGSTGNKGQLIGVALASLLSPVGAMLAGANWLLGNTNWKKSIPTLITVALYRRKYGLVGSEQIRESSGPTNNKTGSIFNKDVKDKAIESLKVSVNKYNDAIAEVLRQSEDLYVLRETASSSTIKAVEKYVNELANRPVEFDKEFAEIRGYFSDFTHYVDRLEADAKNLDAIAGGSTGAGVLAGAGLAALGPTAAVAIATTFGTASTGAAIASLSGAAAANAALAWLGGGALVAGGGGIVAGKALLALAGPVGWGIAAVAMVGGGLYYTSKNAEAAEEVTQRRIEVEGYAKEREVMAKSIKKLIELTQQYAYGIAELLDKLSQQGKKDYLDFDPNEKNQLAALINHTRSLGMLLKKTPEGATE